MKGIVARHGYKNKSSWSQRVQKPKKLVKKKFCLECGKELKFQHGNTLRCGTTREKGNSCARKHYNELNLKWKKDNQYHKRTGRREKQREYERKYDKKRIRIKES